MAYQVMDLSCPSCGAPVSIGQKQCNYCGSSIVITSFTSVFQMQLPEVNKCVGAFSSALAQNPKDATLNKALAMCYLKLRLYAKAQEFFAKAIENDLNDSESYFYAAISLLNGGKPYYAKRADIDRIEAYIQAALMIESKGIYYYFYSYIKYDFFFRKYYKTNPDYVETLAMAKQAGLSEFDIEQLYTILTVDRPACL